MIQVANYTTPIPNEAHVANSELYLIDDLNLLS